MMAAVAIAVSSGQVDRGRRVLSEWLGTHPGDSRAAQTLQDIERRLQSEAPQAGE